MSSNTEIQRLIDDGFQCQHFEAACGDDGDAENGPKFWSHGAYDLWWLQKGNTVLTRVVIDGKIVDADSYPAWLDDKVGG